MPAPPADWHPEEIKARLRMRGTTLAALSLAHGLHAATVSAVLRRPAARVQAIIADALGIDPRRIWPSRYLADGSPRRRGASPAGRHAIRRPAARDCQIGKAA